MTPAGSYRATEVIHRGLLPEVQPGELLPADFLNSEGESEPYNIERLLELGVIEPVKAGEKRPAPAPEPPAASKAKPADAAPQGSKRAKRAPKRAPAASKAKPASK